MSKDSRNIDETGFTLISCHDDPEFLEWLKADIERSRRIEEEEELERIATMKYEELAKCNEELDPVVSFYDAVASVRAPYSVEELRKTYREIARKRTKILNLLSDLMGPKYHEHILCGGDALYVASKISETAERVLNKMETWIKDKEN